MHDLNLIVNQLKISKLLVSIETSFFFLFWLSSPLPCKTTPLHLHPVLHPITFCYIRSPVVLLGLPAHTFSLSPIDYPNIWLDSSQTLLWIVQRHEFALHIDLDTFTLHPSWIILVKNRKSLWPCFDLFNYSLSSECGLLVSSSLIWNMANWIFDGSNH